MNDLAADIETPEHATPPTAILSVAGYRPLATADEHSEGIKLIVRVLDGATEEDIGVPVEVPGVALGPGDKIHARAETIGSNPTTIRVRIWLPSGDEPIAWHDAEAISLEANDPTSGWRLAASADPLRDLVLEFEDLIAATPLGAAEHA